nr:unnamed protein product [Callosobruchus analis]
MAVSKAIKSDTFISQITEKVTEAVTKTLEQPIQKFDATVAQSEEKFTPIVTTLEQKLAEVIKEKSKLEERLDYLDQYNKLCNLRIFNFKEMPQENTRLEIIKLLNAELTLNLNNEDMGKNEGKYQDSRQIVATSSKDDILNVILRKVEETNQDITDLRNKFEEM